jgi:hypothetical protein
VLKSGPAPSLAPRRSLADCDASASGCLICCVHFQLQQVIVSFVSDGTWLPRNICMLRCSSLKDDVQWGAYMTQVVKKKVVRKPVGPSCSECTLTAITGWSYEDPKAVISWCEADEEFKKTFNCGTRIRQATATMFNSHLSALFSSNELGQVIERRRYFISMPEFFKDYKGYKPQDFGWTPQSVRVDFDSFEKGVVMPYCGTKKYRCIVDYFRSGVIHDDYKVHPLNVVHDKHAEGHIQSFKESTASQRPLPNIIRHEGAAVSFQVLDDLVAKKVAVDEAVKTPGTHPDLSDIFRGDSVTHIKGEESDTDESSQEVELEDADIDDNKFVEEIQPDAQAASKAVGKVALGHRHATLYLSIAKCSVIRKVVLQVYLFSKFEW